jgi:hypothetical protein
MDIDEATFWARVQVGEPDECWPWLGGKNNTGYGTLRWGGKIAVAHRVAAVLYAIVKSIEAPKDRRNSGFILHDCDNPGCCNPAHFTVGTYSQNQKDAYTRGRKIQPRSAHSNAKLTAGQVILVRTAYAGGTTQKNLAAQYSVTQRVISLIVRNETYKDVAWT